MGSLGIRDLQYFKTTSQPTRILHHDNHAAYLNPQQALKPIFDNADTYICFVDGYGTSEQAPTRICWILYNKSSTTIYQGQVSIPPTSSPVETEAEALRIALIHLKNLGYDDIIFCVTSFSRYNWLSMQLIQLCQHIFKTFCSLLKILKLYLS